MAKIGVEYSLQNVQEALREKGHEVVNMQSEQDAQGCDCCVVTGLDSNLMGMNDTVIQGPVIEASGLTADEVCDKVTQNLP